MFAPAWSREHSTLKIAIIEQYTTQSIIPYHTFEKGGEKRSKKKKGPLNPGERKSKNKNPRPFQRDKLLLHSILLNYLYILLQAGENSQFRGLCTKSAPSLNYSYENNFPNVIQAPLRSLSETAGVGNIYLRLCIRFSSIVSLFFFFFEVTRWESQNGVFFPD